MCPAPDHAWRGEGGPPAAVGLLRERLSTHASAVWRAAIVSGLYRREPDMTTKPLTRDTAIALIAILLLAFNLRPVATSVLPSS